MINSITESQEVAASSSERVDSHLRGKNAAIVVFSYYPSDVRVLRGAEAMSRAGMNVDLLCLQKSPEEPAREKINGVDVSRIALEKRRAGKLTYASQYFTFLFLSFFWLSRRQLNRRYELVHVHNMPDFLVFCAAFAKALGSRVILDLHDPTPEVFTSVYGLPAEHWLVSLLRCVEKLSISFADKVVTPNIAFRDLFTKRSCRSDKIEIVMNSPLEEVFPFQEPGEELLSARSPDAPFVVMFHGTLVERHGLHTAIEAAALLRERMPGLRFRIYGQETEYLRVHVLPLIASLGLQDCVHYLGEQPQLVIARAVAACDVGIVPNLKTVFTEINLPTRIFEYLALGKPVIVPETQGIQDYFSKEKILYFKGGQASSLASQIRWVFDHPDEARSIVRKGQEVYRNHLWKDEEERFMKLVSGIVR
jgi:glycosyltransferase involved in cell wall biosynthesis